MTGQPAHALLLFVDGVGMGEPDPEVNPFLAARLPHLRGLLGGRLPVLGSEAGDAGGGAWLAAADACLGVEGRPQSGTGQTALLTGHNAAALVGRHFGPWVPVALRDLLARENLLSRALAGGRRVGFANAYPAGFLDARARRRPAAPPLAAQAAGVLDRHAAALREGRAVASSLTNDAWRAHLDPGVPAVSAAAAGVVLARVARESDLTLFAHYDTDLAGHRQDMAAAVEALERLDAFLGGLLGALGGDTLLVVASDHGNLEDVTTGHTRNPVPVVAAGPGAATIGARVAAITDVAPALLSTLGID
jgi:2,3-bisphosphoglycerate-independent phosphoglycerate mutase